MREYIETQFHARIVQWAEHDGETETFSAISAHGSYLQSDTLAGLISTLQAQDPRPLVLVERMAA